MDGLEFLRNEMLKKIQKERLSPDSVYSVFESVFVKTQNKMCDLYDNPKTKSQAQSIISNLRNEKVIKATQKRLKNPSDIFFSHPEREIFDLIWHKKPTRNGNEDRYAMCLGYFSFEEFKKKNKNKIEGIEHDTSFSQEFLNQNKSLIPFNILEENNNKSRTLNKFFNHDCYLYVFDQDAADDLNKDKKELDHYPSIDRLVLKRNGSDFSLQNIDGDEGIKRNYYNGILEWGDCERKTFNISFRNHKRNLYLRFHFTDVDKPEIIMGKFIFSQEGVRIVVSGSAILSKENNIKNKEAFNYIFSNRIHNRLEEIPLQVQIYLFDKFYNWQKTPKKIFNLRKLDNWLKHKLEEQYTKKNIVVHDFLISYPVSSLEINENGLNWNKKNNEKTDLFPKIQEILINGVKPSSSIESGTRKGKIYDKRSLKIMSVFLQKSYNENNRDKTKILVYPEFRDYEPSNDSLSNEIVSLEFFAKIRRSFNIIFIIPEIDFQKISEFDDKKLLELIKIQRPSSVYTFIGFCVALKKRVFIFCKNTKKLPIILQKDCSKLDIYINYYETMEEIPFRINEELKVIPTRFN